jgi:hypothetical protein
MVECRTRVQGVPGFPNLLQRHVGSGLIANVMMYVRLKPVGEILFPNSHDIFFNILLE